jgi:hypothetical protein
MTTVDTAADQRALELWGEYRNQLAHCERLEQTTNDEECGSAHKTLFAIENELRALIHTSTVALGAVLMLEVEGETPEEVEGLNIACLKAIRSQLSSDIAEEAERLLTHDERRRKDDRQQYLGRP